VSSASIKKIKSTLGVFLATILMLMAFVYLPLYLKKHGFEKRKQKTLMDVKELTPRLKVTAEDIALCLKRVSDPEFGADIYDLGMVENIAVDKNNNVEIVLLSYPQCPYQIELILLVKEAVKQIQGVRDTRVRFDPSKYLDCTKIKTDIFKDTER
jgi:metal-sulfur cluster biosynthetic enzyme